MGPVKMAIVWRSDLVCKYEGKKMAQAGHGAHLWLTQKMVAQPKVGSGLNRVYADVTDAELEWMNTNYRKVVLKVDTEADLNRLYEHAYDLGLPVKLVVDEGLTEFNGKTTTCLAIGPALDEEVDRVTGKSGPLGRLKLM